ncbi:MULTISPECIES: response regulator [unclassified Oceanispirochaeta]|uniref:response regulator transcription factor n=1 Tax=unclassified Oceanispirochaeta TaxID=2635722 RepID=UPI000E09B9EC|nr:MULTISPECIES: response regulator [unclassified Oceanispirochaeta]MBF9014553.1 response regulator [Oceanispirochaeta sp. M2]NPD70809.1 response regulator [Oceanispirochaeta sp. M1]RDG34092.1 response regulator [Oceanispirochaeta sp. M1]
MKILFVDDEKWTLEYLELAIDWSSLGMEIVGKACNGREAIPLITEKEPDIAIVDIRMPVMDGLELMEWIKENRPFLKVIILSAYGEFEYAQKALSLRASGYLLKPLDETKMIKEIQRLSGLIESERSRKNNFVRMQVQLSESKQREKEQLLSRLLSPGADVQDILTELKKMDMDTENTCWYLLVISETEKGDGEIRNSVSECSGIDGRSIVFRKSPEEWVVLICCGNDQDYETFGQYSAEAISQNITEGDGTKPLIVVSECQYDLDTLNDAYQTIMKLINNRLFSPSERIITVSHSTSRDENSRLIEKVRLYMKNNYSRPIGLEDIAVDVGLSRNYLCYLFKKETGLNIWDYLTAHRIEEAKKLLHESNDKTYEVALKVGYETPGYFSKMFKKYVGTTPREYKSRL